MLDCRFLKTLQVSNELNDDVFAVYQLLNRDLYFSIRCASQNSTYKLLKEKEHFTTNILYRKTNLFIQPEIKNSTSSQTKSEFFFRNFHNNEDIYEKLSTD